MPDCSIRSSRLTRRLADEDSRVFRPPGEHPGIDALLAGHRNDQQPDPPRLELIAERSDRGEWVGGIALGSAGLPLDRIAHARSIEEPAVTPHDDLLAGIVEEPPLDVLHPRPELLDHETRLLEAPLVLMQVPGRRRLAEDVEHAGLLAVPKLGNRLNQARRHDHGEEDGGHEDVRTTVRPHGREPRTGSRGTG